MPEFDLTKLPDQPEVNLSVLPDQPKKAVQSIQKQDDPGIIEKYRQYRQTQNIERKTGRAGDIIANIGKDIPELAFVPTDIALHIKDIIESEKSVGGKIKEGAEFGAELVTAPMQAMTDLLEASQINPTVGVGSIIDMLGGEGYEDFARKRMGEKQEQVAKNPLMTLLMATGAGKIAKGSITKAKASPKTTAKPTTKAQPKTVEPPKPKPKVRIEKTKIKNDPFVERMKEAGAEAESFRIKEIPIDEKPFARQAAGFKEHVKREAALKNNKGETVNKVRFGDQPMYMVDPLVMEVGNKVESVKKAFTGEPSSKINEVAREAALERSGEIKVAGFEAGKYKRKLDKSFTEKQLEDMTFYREKTGNPYLKEDTFESLSKRLPESAKMAVEDIGKRLGEIRDKVNDSGWSKEVGFVENYISHVYTGRGLSKKAKEFGKTWARKNPFANKRTFETFEKAINEAGLTPRYTKINDLVQYYENVNAAVIANNKMIGTLQKMKLPDGTRAIMPKGKAPADYRTVDHYALNRRYTIKGRPIVEQQAVHPEIYPVLRRVFDSGLLFDGIPVLGTLENGLRVVNGLAKNLQLSMSGFHHLALGESGFAAGKNPIRGVREGSQLIKRDPIVKDALRNGLQMESTPDVANTIINKYLKGWEKRWKGIHGVEQVPKGLRMAKEKWDYALWNYIHTNLKLESYNRIKTKNMAKYGDKVSEKQISRETANFVNDAFGGQNWDAYFRSHPKLESIAHLVFLAPDWTLSNLKIAGRGAGSMVGLGPKTVRNNARLYWLRAAMMFSLGQDAAQWMLTKAVDGKGKHMWENDPEHKFDIQLPEKWRDEKGRRQYIKPLKQAREVLRYFTDPSEIIGAKLSPVTKQVIEQFTGHSPGSGFKQPYANIDFWESVPARLKNIASSVVPLSLKGNSFMFVLPKSTGMNNYKTIKLYTETLRSWAEEETKIRRLGKKEYMNDDEIIDALDEITKASNENNLDTKQLFSLALSSLRTKYYSEFFEALNKGDEKEIEKWAKKLQKIGGEKAGLERSLENRYLRAIRENTLDLTKSEARQKIRTGKRAIKRSRNEAVSKYKRKLEKENRRKQTLR